MYCVMLLVENKYAITTDHIYALGRSDGYDEKQDGSFFTIGKVHIDTRI